MVRQISRLMCLGTLTLLGACSIPGSFLQQPADEAVADTEISKVPADEALVENLVQEAAELGYVDIANTPNPPPDDAEQEVEAVIHIIEPEITTVPMSANRVVELQINDFLQNRQSLMRTWIERSHTYFPMIEDIFEEEGIPDELKYLALGESSLLPSVRSSAGAVGMWQFMPATGRGAGLEIDSWVDERMDPEKATRAAAQHMKELYASYGNRWHLALAGYNCSYRCITRAVRRAGGTIETPPSYWEIYPYLPRETRDFIPKYIAAALIISNPEKYGISADSFGEPLAYEVVEVSGMLALEDAARMAGVSEANLRLLNPELLGKTLPDRTEPYALKIPPGSFTRFVTAFNAVPVQGKTSPDEYRVKSGDTLGKIAHSFDTTVLELQTVNVIKGHLININQKLIIPGTGQTTVIELASTESRAVEYGEARYRPIKLSDEFQLVELEGSTPVEPLFAVSLSVSPDEEFVVVPTIYKVRRGDTLGAIASQYSVTVSNIQNWNNLGNSSMIRIGQELTLHAGANTNTVASNTKYEVQSGDSLYTIARRFGVSVDNLKRWNGLKDNLIFPGQSLQLN